MGLCPSQYDDYYAEPNLCKLNNAQADCTLVQTAQSLSHMMPGATSKCTGSVSGGNLSCTVDYPTMCSSTSVDDCGNKVPKDLFSALTSGSSNALLENS